MSSEVACAGEDAPSAVERLRRAVQARLLEFCEEGVPIMKTDAKTGETRMVGRAPAPAPYLSAALKFLKEAGALGSVGGALEALEDELEALPEFDDD